MIVLRWFMYCVHAVLYVIYSFLQFLSKPGSRFLVPGLVLVLGVFVLRPALHDHFHVGLELTLSNAIGLAIDAVCFVTWCAFSWLYGSLSRVIGLLLSIFPLVLRPLPPMGHLKETNDDFRAVVVTLAVPPLRSPAASTTPIETASVVAIPEVMKPPRRQRGSLARWVLFPALGLGGVVLVLAAGLAAYVILNPIYQNNKRAKEAAAEQHKVLLAQYYWSGRMMKEGITLDEERVSCTLHGDVPPFNEASVSPVGNNLVRLGQAHTAVFFIQGLDFLAMAKDGWSSMPALQKRFADAEAAVLEANAALDPTVGAAGPIAICYVRWPTLAGFGDNTAYVEKSMAAFVHLWNAGHEDGLASDPRRLVAVGYSAGGNLAAKSIVDLYSDMDQNKLAHPETILVTIVTPHEGAQAASLSSSTNGIAASLVAKARDLLGFQRDGTDLSSRIDDVERSPGIVQMTPQSPALLRLKADLLEVRQRNDELKIVNIYSSRDDTVPPTSGSLEFADRNIDLPDTGVAHVDFMQAPAGSRMRKALVGILSVPRAVPDAAVSAAVTLPASDAAAASLTPAPAAAETAPQPTTEAQSQPNTLPTEQKPYHPVGAPFTKVTDKGDTVLLQAQSDGTFKIVSINGVKNGSYIDNNWNVIKERWDPG